MHDPDLTGHCRSAAPIGTSSGSHQLSTVHPALRPPPAPSLPAPSPTGAASTAARIRGVGAVGDNPGPEGSVGIVIDGVYRPRNGVSFGDLGEMQRIEVLKGPQGTLFGKNTSAGVINILTKAP